MWYSRHPAMAERRGRRQAPPAATAALPRATVLGARAVILILMLDQAIFTVCDFFTGIAADKVTRVLGRLGVWVTAATALSCAAFLIMPTANASPGQASRPSSWAKR
jgi:hypothetical protein